jgi:hypothetical protein
MPKLELVSDQDFWSGTYAGRRISVFYQHGRWHPYLDHVHQPNVVFATAEETVRWLAGRVDATSVARAA